MAIRKFVGNAPAVKQVRSYTPGSVTVGNIFTLTCNTKTVSFTATVATVANVTAGLVAALNSNTVPVPPEFKEVIWTDATTHILGTASVAGKPFSIFSSAATGTGTPGCTFGPAGGVYVTTPSGPNDISIAANWGGTAPVSGDTIVLENSSVDILYGLDMSAVTGITLLAKPTYTGSIGLPERTNSGYTEYRGTYWKIGLTSVVHEAPTPRAKFDLGNPGAPCSFKVFNTGSSPEQGVPSMLIKGGTASNHIDLQSYKGNIGTAFFAGETCHIGVPTLTYLTSQSSDSRVVFGSGTVFNDNVIDALAGTIELNSNCNLVTCGKQATLTLKGAAAIATSLTNQGGVTIYQSSGTCTQYFGFTGSTLDVRTPCNMTNIALYGGTTLRDPLGLISYGTPILLLGCSLNEVTLDLQPNIQVEILDI